MVLMVNVKIEIKKIIDQYDNNKNFFRKVAWNHHCIRYLKKLDKEIGQNDKLSYQQWIKLFDILVKRSTPPRGEAEILLNDFTRLLFGNIDANRELEHRRQRIWMKTNIVDIFEALANANLLSADNVHLIYHSYGHSDDLITILKVFANTTLLSNEQLKKITLKISDYSLRQAFGILKAKNLLTAENIEAVINKPELAIVFDENTKAGTLTDARRNILINHESPLHLARAFACLDKNDLLNAENETILINHPRPHDLAFAFSYLAKANITIPNIKAAVIAYPDTHALELAFFRLSCHDLLNEERANKILTHRRPGPDGVSNIVEMAFYTLQADDILTAENVDAVLAHPMPSYLADLFVVFSKAGHLTPDTARMWSNVPYQIVCSKDFSDILKYDMPRHLITPHMQAELLRLGSDVNVAIDDRKLQMIRYLNGILNPVLVMQPLRNPDRRYLLLPSHLRNQAAPVNINYAQSVHADSVHKSASSSARKLKELYGKNLDIQAKLNEMGQWVNSLDDDSLEILTAKRAFPVIRNHHFTDRESGVTTPELIALIWCGIHDDDSRLSTLSEAKKVLVEALYEYQRGYNLDAAGNEQGGDDHEICVGGTFNKLLEKMQYILPAVEIRFITNETASLKLPNLVREEAVKYLLGKQKSADTAEKKTDFDKLLNQFCEEGISAVWENIRKDVFELFYDEFKSVWNNDKSDRDFIAAVDAGEYAAIESMEKLLNKHKITLFKTKEIPLDELEIEAQEALKDEADDEVVTTAFCTRNKH